MKVMNTSKMSVCLSKYPTESQRVEEKKRRQGTLGESDSRSNYIYKGKLYWIQQVLHAVTRCIQLSISETIPENVTEREIFQSIK